jgi:hypothetical protein
MNELALFTIGLKLRLQLDTSVDYRFDESLVQNCSLSVSFIFVYRCLTSLINLDSMPYEPGKIILRKCIAC